MAATSTTTDATASPIPPPPATPPSATPPSATQADDKQAGDTQAGDKQAGDEKAVDTQAGDEKAVYTPVPACLVKRPLPGPDRTAEPGSTNTEQPKKKIKRTKTKMPTRTQADFFYARSLDTEWGPRILHALTPTTANGKGYYKIAVQKILRLMDNKDKGIKSDSDDSDDSDDEDAGDDDEDNVTIQQLQDAAFIREIARSGII